MHHNQTSSTHSTFKMPMLPQPPPSQSETLLFNDIMEEKTQSLRNLLNEFLQVQPYRRFDVEFSNFLKRTKRIIQEVQRSGANASRITNSSQIAPIYSQPSASFNYRPLTPMSMTSSNTSNRTSMFRAPQNSFRPIEPINPFKPPVNYSYEPRVELPRIEQSMYASHNSPTYATVIEVNQVENETARTNNMHTVHVNYQPSESEVQPQSATHNSYSDVTIIEDRSASSSQRNPENDEKDDEDNSVESLLESVGFKILVGLPNQSDRSQNTKKCSESQSKNEENVQENIEKYLTTWSLNMKIIKSQLKPSKVFVLLTGTLLEKDRVTIIEKRHEAGFLECRKENNLVKTNKGLYRLIGNIIGGHPNELYESCVSLKGIPRFWRNIVKQHSGVEKTTKNALLNFSLDSPAGPGPIKQKKNALLDMSMTRKGTNYSKNMSVVGQKTSGKRKIPEHDDVPENSKNKHRKLSPLLASTPKRPRKQATMFETPSQILKNKIRQNLCNKTSAKQDSKTLNTANDSINVTKKRQSISREQISVFLKPKEPLKTSLSSNNSSKRSRQSIENSSVRSINKSINKNLTKQTSMNINQSKQTSMIKNQSKQTSIIKNQSKQTSIIKNQSKQTSIIKNQSKQTSIIKNQSKQASININESTDKPMSANNSDKSNCSLSLQSNIKPSRNSAEMSNSTEQKCKFISSLNSTKNSPIKSVQNIPKINNKPTKVVKAVNKKDLTKLVKNKKLSPKITLSNIDNSKNVTEVKKKNKNCSNTLKNTNVLVNKSNTQPKKPKKNQCNPSTVGSSDLFGNMGDAAYDDVNDFNILSSPSKLSMISRTDKSRSETPPLFGNNWNSTVKSVVFSEPPTPLSKSAEAKELKRIKAPKLTIEDEIKSNKTKNKKKAIDYNTFSKKIDKMLEFGEQYDNDDD